MTLLKLAKLDDQPEIFHTIQGEGKSIGTPSVFIRTSLCNLHCIWCDTDYTWNWEKTRFKHNKDKEPGYSKYRMEDVIIEMSIPDIFEIVDKTRCRHIVLTGGEPMMQMEELADLIRYFRAKDNRFFFETETNGTIVPTPSFDGLVDQYNVSPKLENSNNPRKLREKPKAYRFFSASPKANFKFVISAEKDMEEVLALCETYRIDPGKVYLMPEGVNPGELKQRQSWLIDVCKKYDMKYTDRLHIRIFGDVRGV